MRLIPIVAAAVIAAASGAATTQAAAAETATGGAAAIAVVMKDGTPALNIILPPGWTAVQGEHRTVLRSPTGAPHVEVWPTDAPSLDQAVTDAPKLISEYVTDFVVESTEDHTVADAPARGLFGRGAEADDGDAGRAALCLFTIHHTVWALLAHGEGHGVDQQMDALNSIVQSIVAAQ